MSDYKHLVKEITESEFNEFVLPFLPKKISGRRAKVPLWRVYNYIAKVLRTGMQWKELQDCIAKDTAGNPEIHYTNVFRRFSQWVNFGVFDKSHRAILAASYKANQLDLSVLNGDGTNTIAKKGVQNGATRVINTKRVQNVLALQTKKVTCCI
jgi:transposase